MLVGAGAFVVGLRDRVVAGRVTPEVAVAPGHDGDLNPFNRPGGMGGPTGAKGAPGDVAPSIVRVDGVASGSGVVVSEDGIVLTSADLVGSKPEITITFDDGTSVVGTNLGADDDTNVAVIDLPDGKTASARLVPPDELDVGDTVMLAGVDAEGNLVTTSGTLEAGEETPGNDYEWKSGAQMLQVAANDMLSPELQGAAVVDASGAVLGLTTWSDDQRFYVAPIDVAGDIANELFTIGVPAGG